MNNKIKFGLFFVGGLILGMLVTGLIVTSPSPKKLIKPAGTPNIHVVVQPSKDLKLKYKEKNFSYSFDNPNKNWSVVIKNDETKTLGRYELKNPFPPDDGKESILIP